MKMHARYTGIWNALSVVRNGVNMGTFTRLRMRLVHDYSTGSASLQAALAVTMRRPKGPSQRFIDQLVQRANSLQADLTFNKQKAKVTIDLLRTLVRDLRYTSDPYGKFLIDDALYEIQHIIDNPKLWE